MSRPAKIGSIVGVSVLILGVLLAQFSTSGSSGERRTGPDPEDAGPSGLLGLSILLNDSEHSVERVAEAPASGDLDPEKTAILVDPGTLTAADASALHDLADDGGRVVVAGDPGADATSRLLGTDAEVAGASSLGPFSPLLPAPETSGIAVVEAEGSSVVSPAGGALPLIGASGEALAVAADVGSGRVVLLADPSPLQNGLLASSDNARFALNLAGPNGREVQLVEVVRAPPGSGLAALPSEWGWTAGGLLLAVLVLAFARGRRLGPPELEARPLPPPRRQYVEALAAALVRTRDPATAVAPLRDAGRERLARRAGLAHDADDAALRRAGQAAGLEPAEVEALCGAGGDEDAMLAVAGAVAKLTTKT